MLLLVSVPVVFELGMVGVLYNLLGQAKEAQHKADSSRQVVGHVNSALLAYIERMQMLYLNKLSESPKIEEKIHLLAGKASSELKIVHTLAADNPEEGAYFTQIADLVEGLSGAVQKVNNIYSGGEKEKAIKEWAKLQYRIDSVMNFADDFFVKQAKFQVEKQRALEAREREITVALWASIFISILTAFGMAYVFNRSTSDRLQKIMDNTNRIAAGKAPQGLVGGDDELTAIDRVYHQMYKDLVNLREKERALLDNAAELICSIDTNLRISDINRSAEKILGHPQQELIGLRALDLMEDSEREREKVRLALEEAFDKTEPAHFDCKMKRADGTIIDTEWATSAAAGGDSIYCVILDVTQRKLIEQMRRDFVAMVSHDLRTPLTSIQMTLSLTQEEAEASRGLTKEGIDGLATAQHSANRLLALVNNLLDLEKLESGVFELQARMRPLGAVLQEALGSVENLARQKKISLRLEIPTDLDAYFDDERITQVVINLVSNSIKFSPKESIISVSASRNQDMVRLAITDHGRGIPTEMRTQIFDRFKQVSSQDQYQMKGTGLGLAICKAIVERHRGTIGVDSSVGSAPVQLNANEKGPGSTFWFTLPASQSVFNKLNEEAKNRVSG